ncbi:DUF2182 domain-containing protein [Microvirga massiliensis]|uniref:copper chaperone n=1 Tax=Microvirga massiliensis TaxID=1033741 RepID=UPI00164DE4A6|nr:DUF2182 domain-containing protein [Microvirga massiliensis]
MQTFLAVFAMWPIMMAAMMLLLFTGGVMNLVVVALLAIGIGLEKLAPGGSRIARSLGVMLGMIVLGRWSWSRMH